MTALKSVSVRVHVCACPGCGRLIPTDLAFCLTHWRDLPPHLTEAVNRTYRCGDDEAQLAAMRDAIEHFIPKGGR